MLEHITHARVVRTTGLTKHLLHVILAPEPYIDYEAGQYLQLISAPHALSYSIANAPNASRTYELHIRHGRETSGHERLLHEMTLQRLVTLRMPLGQCTLRALDPIKPILFIAGGTGFAPIKAMIEQLRMDGQTRPVMLYWNARSADDLYMDDLARGWEKKAPWFTYCSRRSETNKESIASLVIKHRVSDLRDWQIVLAGPFDMVYTLRDELVAQGVSPRQLYSDAFAFEAKI